MKNITMIAIFLCLFLTLSIVQVQAEENTKCHFKVGVVPQFEQRRIFEVWSSILDEIEEKTECKFELIGSKTILEFEKSFQEGVYDFAYMNPYHAVMAKKAQGYEPIVRSGSKKLKGILVVKKDSPIQNVNELKDKELAFPSPNALGASLLMRAELATKHDTPVQPKYVKTHSSVYLHVAKGLTIAGGGVGRTLAEQPDHIKNSLRVLYTTTPVHAHPLVAHPRVGEDYSKKLQSAWLALAEEQKMLFDGVPMKESIATSYDDYVGLEDFGLENFVGTKE